MKTQSLKCIKKEQSLLYDQALSYLQRMVSRDSEPAWGQALPTKKTAVSSKLKKRSLAVPSGK